MYKLTIELVPETCWYSNVRSNVSRAMWDKIRHKSYALANHKCEICKDTGKNQGYKHAVECHEIWHYDDTTKTQTLTQFISLCPNCHTVKHPGLASINGKTHVVLNQLMKVNKMSMIEAKSYLNSSYEQFEERSKYNWTLDISYIEKFLEEKEKTFDDLFSI
ncbi:MAG: HNH endonuclease [Spirochaetes bacterium]|nr:MAG: HNH endonuclease [Spirochaetota bacterium]